MNTEARLKVDDSGRVGVVFHGTESDFRAFRDGVTWFTPDREETVHQYRTDESKPWFVFHATLTLRCPADMDDARVRALLESAAFDPDQIGVLSEYSSEIIPLLESHGYDGLTAQMGSVRHYAAFHPFQIRVHRREIIPVSTP